MQRPARRALQHLHQSRIDVAHASQCSGLPVARYSAEALHREFGAPFLLVEHAKEEHRTPAGAVQKFVYCYCRTRNS